MPDREEMNPVLPQIEPVNDPIIANTSSKTARSFQAMMRERAELQTNLVNFCFNSRAKSGWKLEKYSVKTRVIDLRYGTHELSGSRTRTAFPAAMSRSDC